MERSLAQALADFDEKHVLEKVVQLLNRGDEPITLVRQLQGGMGLVGERFSQGDFFLSELMMSADIFTKAMELVEPRLESTNQETLGKIVIGTPKGDIHDIGKNIFCAVAKGAGFEIYDLGVDVSVETFVEAVERERPEILGFSALITTGFEPMKNVVDSLMEKGLRERTKIIVGGGVTTETVRKYVGADAQTIDAVEGLNICKNFVQL